MAGAAHEAIQQFFPKRWASMWGARSGSPEAGITSPSPSTWALASSTWTTSRSASDTEPFPGHERSTIEWGEQDARVQSDPGAITVDADERELVIAAAKELTEAILTENELAPDDIVSAIFTSTADLTSAFPALGRGRRALATRRCCAPRRSRCRAVKPVAFGCWSTPTWMLPGPSATSTSRKRSR